MSIINLTQHRATNEQEAVGVFSTSEIASIAALGNFTTMPTREEIKSRANEIAISLSALGLSAKQVMIGGAPFFMGALEFALEEAGFEPIYAFSERVSQDVLNPDGSTTKTSIFKHVGFI